MAHQAQIKGFIGKKQARFFIKRVGDAEVRQLRFQEKGVGSAADKYTDIAIIKGAAVTVFDLNFDTPVVNQIPDFLGNKPGQDGLGLLG